MLSHKHNYEGNHVNNKNVYNRYIYNFFKRLLDIIASLVGLLGLSWLFLIVSILIKFDDPSGKVIYSQKRNGLNGKEFKLYKFRSMIPDAENKKQNLLKYNQIKGLMFKMEDDPRVTKIGHHLRKHSIDELPQLINVLKGDMSLVGPRPPLPNELINYDRYDMQRLMVVPGLTGLWQVSGRNNLSFSQMVKLDIYYINHSGFTYDLKIIFKTIKVVMIPNDAY